MINLYDLCSSNFIFYCRNKNEHFHFPLNYLVNYWMDCLNCSSNIHVSHRINCSHFDDFLTFHFVPMGFVLSRKIEERSKRLNSSFGLYSMDTVAKVIDATQLMLASHYGHLSSMLAYMLAKLLLIAKSIVSVLDVFPAYHEPIINVERMLAYWY